MHNGSLKLGTFNIRTTAVGNTGRLRWTRRRHVIESVIRREDPDLLALQEVTNRTHGIPHDVDQLEWLAETFPELEIAVGTIPSEPPADNPILIRRGRLEPRDRGFLAFDREGLVIAGGIDPSLLRGGPHSRIRRNQAARHLSKSFVGWGVMRETDWGRDIAVYNVHLDARNPNFRRRQAQLIIEAITRLGHDEMPVMVLGDFNSFRGSPPVRALERLGLAPVIETNRRGTFHFGLGVTLWPRIDHILVSEDLNVRGGYIERHSHEGIYPSDHYPVFAELEPGAYGRNGSS
jgi:endonuclease/exonuclease/phosphatase family metal-dependent hydrolase